ncbi:winged helix-turn-helix transcriptional regulator [Amycolatopsis sp. NPDC004368]
MTDRRYWCPVELIGGRWKPVSLSHLKEGVHRYGELRFVLPELSSSFPGLDH